MSIPHRDGDTYDHGRDGFRLAGQHGRVFDVLSDGKPHSIPEIQDEIKRRFSRRDSETGISARIRDFRKEQFGAYEVESMEPGSGGLWTYRIHM